jgi:hypothetical protein
MGECYGRGALTLDVVSRTLDVDHTSDHTTPSVRPPARTAPRPPPRPKTHHVFVSGVILRLASAILQILLHSTPVAGAPCSAAAHASCHAYASSFDRRLLHRSACLQHMPSAARPHAAAEGLRCRRGGHPAAAFAHPVEAPLDTGAPVGGVEEGGGGHQTRPRPSRSPPTPACLPPFLSAALPRQLLSSSQGSAIDGEEEALSRAQQL